MTLAALEPLDYVCVDHYQGTSALVSIVWVEFIQLVLFIKMQMLHFIQPLLRVNVSAPHYSKVGTYRVQMPVVQMQMVQNKD